MTTSSWSTSATAGISKAVARRASFNLVDIDAPGVADVSSNASFLANSPAAVALRKVPFLDVVAVNKSRDLDPS